MIKFYLRCLTIGLIIYTANGAEARLVDYNCCIIGEAVCKEECLKAFPYGHKDRVPCVDSCEAGANACIAHP